jgi:tryptophan-rich hypothetical protein
MSLPTTVRVNPAKLLRSKWTAATPRNKEKHFMVIKVLEPLSPSIQIDLIELEAVHSRRVQTLSWRALLDDTQWRQGWV